MNATALHPAVTEVFLAIMRRRHPELLWSVKGTPEKTDARVDRGPLAA